MNRRCPNSPCQVGALLSVLALTTAATLAGPSTKKLTAYAQQIYPFGTFPNPYTQTVPDQSPPVAFVPDVLWPLEGDAATNNRMRGFTYTGLAWLQLITPLGTDGATAWEIRHVDDTEWKAWQAPALLLNALRKDVYEVRAVTPAIGPASPPAFWLACPTNTIRPDRHPPAGAVHGEIDPGVPFPLLRVWGHAWDAMQAGLAGSCGVSRAEVDIDGWRLPVALDAQGFFAFEMDVFRSTNGVHTLTLYAADYAHINLSLVDTEVVSEYGWLLINAPPPDPRTWATWGFRFQYITSTDNTFSFGEPPTPKLVAKPRLDASGLLILDARESVGVAIIDWNVESLTSPTNYPREGDMVATEDIPAGLYRVTCESWLTWLPEPTNLTTSFFLVIPPRINLAARQPAGALHLRWVPELIRREWVWSLYASGHIFDEIGTALHGHTPRNLSAAFTIDYDQLGLPLDKTGAFFTRRVMKQPFPAEIDFGLKVWTRDATAPGFIDTRSETRLTIFPPWDFFYPDR